MARALAQLSILKEFAASRQLTTEEVAQLDRELARHEDILYSMRCAAEWLMRSGTRCAPLPCSL